MNAETAEENNVVGFRLPDSLRERAEALRKLKHFRNISEYARDLIRRDVERHEADQVRHSTSEVAS